MHNIETLNAAVSDHVSKIRLYISDFQGRSSIVGQGEYITVYCVTLDSVLQVKDRIGIIKIDAEGAEDFILRDATNILKTTKFVIVEIRHPETSESSSINQYLTKCGFVYSRRCESNSIFINKILSVKLIAQLSSRLVTISFVLLWFAGFIFLVIKRKQRETDKAFFLTGILYSGVGAVLYTLGTRTIPLKNF